MGRRLPTKPGRLSDLARHVVLPSGLVSTGWPAVKDRCAEFGDTFDEWQDGLGRAILGKRANGLYAATVGGVTLSIPRQVAKTFLIGRIVVALCTLYPGLTVLWTAHHNRTLTRTFRSQQAFVKRKKVSAYLAPNGIRESHGEQEIKFSNGSMIMFGAREQGFGRGFEEVDIEVFDEAQILTEKALEDMIAATNQTQHPHGALLFYMGTPPRPTDPGEVFTLKRSQALSDEADDMIYVECGADPDAESDDRKQWAKANPSFPERTNLTSMLRMRKNLPSEDSWRREALGIWDDEGLSAVIDTITWNKLVDESLVDVGAPAFAAVAYGIDVSPDRRHSSISMAAWAQDGRLFLEWVDGRESPDWVVSEAKKIYAAGRARCFVVDGASPAAGFAQDLIDAEVPVVVTNGREYAASCARLYDSAYSGLLAHLGQPTLTTALSKASKRDIGAEGAWAWNRKKADSNITPLVAATIAIHGLSAPDIKGGPQRRPQLYAF